MILLQASTTRTHIICLFIYHFNILFLIFYYFFPTSKFSIYFITPSTTADISTMYKAILLQIKSSMTMITFVPIVNNFILCFMYCDRNFTLFCMTLFRYIYVITMFMYRFFWFSIRIAVIRIAYTVVATWFIIGRIIVSSTWFT